MASAGRVGRNTALALGAARIGLGAGALFATSRTLKALLFGETDATGRALAKLPGGATWCSVPRFWRPGTTRGALRWITLTAALLDVRTP